VVAFFTKEALEQIARCTITSVADLHRDATKPPSNYILHNHQVGTTHPFAMKLHVPDVCILWWVCRLVPVSW
jgi:hypothetical protein